MLLVHYLAIKYSACSHYPKIMNILFRIIIVFIHYHLAPGVLVLRSVQFSANDKDIIKVL